jgi:uncharacterized membrane protein YidH (DUF202 family)
MPPGDPEEESADRRTSLAGERTNLAAERTLLAWWRTGLAALAVALAVGRVLPELTDHKTRWPYIALGAGFALYGIAMFMLGARRTEHSSEDSTLVVFMGAGVILGIGTLVLIAAQ